jgi:hypothetical protein
LAAARHGYIKGHYDRQDLKYREHLNAEIIHIDTKVDGFKQNLSPQKACDKLAADCICHCKGDCEKTLTVHGDHQDPSAQLFVTREEEIIIIISAHFYMSYGVIMISAMINNTRIAIVPDK